MIKKYTKLSKNEEEKALELHKKAIGINALSLFSGRNGYIGIKNFQKYCETMKMGDVSAANMTVANNHNMGQACWEIANIFNLLNEIDDAMLILKAEDIREVKRLGKAGIIIGFQNTEPFETNIGLSHTFKCWGPLELYHRLGVRIIQLTYSRRARAGDGFDERKDGGVSKVGIDLIEGMNKLGILIDLSHCGPKTTLETIEFSKDPVAFTHSGAKGVHDTGRLKGDEQIKALAEKDGVMGIVAESMILGKPTASLDDLLDHVDYVNNLVGSKHIGIGGDIQEVMSHETLKTRFRNTQELAAKRWKTIPNQDPETYPWLHYVKDINPETVYVEGFNTMAKTLNVTKGLVARSYSDKEIIGILGGNFLRLFEKVWRK